MKSEKRLMLSIKIDSELKKSMRIRCAQKDEEIGEFVRRLIREALKKEGFIK